jgi:carbamoyl-phosphate synthase small subunit
MDGYILLSDGMRLDGKLAGAQKTAFGWLAANTAVVGFQEMVTDPAYAGRVLVFTYPEVGNVGVTAAFSESPRVQAAAIVVKVLSSFRSHYLSEDSFESMLKRDGVLCLTDIDTRGLAVHLRDRGEMAAAIAPADADEKELKSKLTSVKSPAFRTVETCAPPQGKGGPIVAVLNLGARRSTLEQLALCCRPKAVPHDAASNAILALKPAGLFISDGPAAAPPPAGAVETIETLLGKMPMFACGLGSVALGMALGCKTVSLRRGHHGANYPVRNVIDGKVDVTAQRHTVMLDRSSVESCKDAELLWENMNDKTVEGIRSRDGSAEGVQFIPAAPEPGAINPHIKAFIGRLGER